jgi:hypothetical protein
MNTAIAVLLGFMVGVLAGAIGHYLYSYITIMKAIEGP